MILVRRCLHLCCKKLGQYINSLSICSTRQSLGILLFKALTNLCKSLCIIFGQLDLFPHFCWRVCSLRSFHIQIDDTYYTSKTFKYSITDDSTYNVAAVTFFFSQGRIPTVSKGAGLTVAKTSDIVRIAAKVLFGCSITMNRNNS